MECNGCVFYRYEGDTNFSYCTNEKQEFEGQGAFLKGDADCELYYSIEDAKADAKYGSCDKY